MPSSLFFVYKQPLDGSMSPLFRGGKLLPIGNSSRCAVRNLVFDADSCARCVGVLRRDKTRLYLMTQVGSIIQHTLPPPSPSVPPPPLPLFPPPALPLSAFLPPLSLFCPICQFRSALLSRRRQVLLVLVRSGAEPGQSGGREERDVAAEREHSLRR